jgi:flagellar biosynthesis protein FlhF
LEHVYRSRRFDEAMAKVKDSLGPNAFILSARQLSADPRYGGSGEVEIKAISPFEAAQMGLTSRNDADLLAMERTLRQAEVPPTIARLLMQRIEMEYSGQSLSASSSTNALAKALKHQMIFGGPAGSCARVVALVGPTGVGKTTTAAKLAAYGALLQDHFVALICIDLYRIGGAEQLERYSDLIGIPMEVASDIDSLNKALRSFARAELVIIDTAGCSSKDHETLDVMAQCVTGVSEPVEVHLCLDAAVREREMESVIDRYAALQPMRLIVTKVDEAVCLGSIVAAQALSGLPLTYLTTGQKVPQDIELATPERIATLLCKVGSKL